MLGAVRKHRDKGVLEQEQVALSLAVGHLLEHPRGEDVDRRRRSRQRVAAKKAEPLHLGELGPVGIDSEVRRHFSPEVGCGVHTSKQRGEVCVGLALEAVNPVGAQPTEARHLLHRRAPAREAQSTAEHHVARVDAVNLGVGHRVAVGVALESGLLALDRHRHRPHVVEELLTGDIDHLTVSAVASVVKASEQHAARAPRKLVAVGVVIGLGRRQAATIRLEGGDLATISLHTVDHLHCRHVVDAGVDAELVEEDQALFLGFGVKRHHVVLDIGRGHHVLSLFETGSGHLRMKLPRQ